MIGRMGGRLIGTDARRPANTAGHDGKAPKAPERGRNGRIWRFRATGRRGRRGGSVEKNGAGGIYGPMAVEGLGRWGRVYRPYHWRDSGIGCGARRCAAGAGGVSSLVYW